MCAARVAKSKHERAAIVGLVAGRARRLDAERSSELSEACQLVERAKGILAQNLRIDKDEASLILQRLSRQRRKSIKELAEAVLIVEEITRPEEPPPC